MRPFKQIHGRTCHRLGVWNLPRTHQVPAQVPVGHVSVDKRRRVSSSNLVTTVVVESNEMLELAVFAPRFDDRAFIDERGGKKVGDSRCIISVESSSL